MNHEDTTAEILAMETSLLRPPVRSSAEQLDELLAENFREFTASGRECGKPACLKALPREPAPAFKIDDFEVQILTPSVALATYRLTRATDGGETRSLRSSLWRFEEGRWRLVFHQGTPAQP